MNIFTTLFALAAPITTGLHSHQGVPLDSPAAIVALDGNRFEGTVVEISDSKIELRIGAELREFASADVASVEFGSIASIQDTPHTSGQSMATISLLDGSRIQSERFTFSDQRFQIDAGDATIEEIESVAVGSIWFGGEATPDIERQWQRLVQDPPGAGDLLVVRRADALDYLDGIVREIADDRIAFEYEGQVMSAPRSRAAGIVFYRPQRADSVATTDRRLKTSSGNELNFARLQWKQGQSQIAVETVAGVSVAVDVDQVHAIEFTTSGAEFLSLIEPLEVHWHPVVASATTEPYLTQLNRPRFDQSFGGGPLTLRPAAAIDFDQPEPELLRFRHGLALRGGSRLSWRLDGQYTRLEGKVGLAPEADHNGAVELRIIVDGRQHLKQTVNGNRTEPLDLDVDLSDATRLTIETHYVHNRPVGDIVHLGDLKVYR